MYLRGTADGARGQGHRAWEQGDKGCPSLLQVTAPKLVLQGAPLELGLSEQIYLQVPTHRQRGKPGCPSSEQKVLAPNELCQFTLS